jgi:hypothetical protein
MTDDEVLATIRGMLKCRILSVREEKALQAVVKYYEERIAYLKRQVQPAGTP